MSIVTAVLIAIMQGVTELFPVSSLGHAVILPALLKLNIDQNAPEFLPFLVVLHVGTAVALLCYFWRDWVGILKGLLAGGMERRNSLQLLTLIIVATIPAVIIGAVLQKPLKSLFGSPLIAACFLVVNGFLLFGGERLKNRLSKQGGDVSTLTWKGALAIGFWQCLAFFPGLSRSGATLVGGLLAGLTHRASAHFSFLIATPIILGAAVLEIPKLLHEQAAPGALQVSIIGGIAAGITAWLSIVFLMRYFRRHEFDALDPFAWYCWAFGAGAVLWLAFS